MAVSRLRLTTLICLNIFLLPFYFICFILSLAAAFLPLFPTRVGIRNLRERLGSGFFASRFQMCLVYMHYAFYLAEAFFFSFLGLNLVKGKETLSNLLKEMQSGHATTHSGFFVLGAHFGNIEVAGQVLNDTLLLDCNSPCLYLAKKSRIQAISRLLEWYRTRHSIQHLWTERRDLARAMMEHLKKGGSLAVLADQKPATAGVFVKFFGRFAAFPAAGIDIGLRMGVPVIFCSSRRIIPGLHEMIVGAPPNSHLNPTEGQPPYPTTLSNDFYDANITEKERRTASVIAAFAWWLEKIIRQNPTQWAWDYKKWSREPKQIKEVVP